MYIIKQGKAYIVKGNQAHEIRFNDDLTYKTAKEGIEFNGEKTYNLDEVMAKLNIRYQIETKLEEEALASMGDKALLEKVELLEAELAEKEAQIGKLEEEIALLTKPADVEQEKKAEEKPSNEQ